MPETGAPSHDPAPLTSDDTDRLEVVKDVVDELIDLTLNYRKSGHPGGSRSKVHFVLGTLLSGAMRWDLLHPWRTFADRFGNPGTGYFLVAVAKCNAFVRVAF